MQLNVLQADQDKQPWFADGLSFTCTQCGNCCTGPPGYVWISQEEITRLAQYLAITPGQVVERYCRKIDGRFSLTEIRNPRHGGYDCVFLKDQAGPGGQTQRVCQIYPVRPLQCRTWPFWDTSLQSPQAWKRAGSRCPGMNTGKHYICQEIEALRDATDWPAQPPSSTI